MLAIEIASIGLQQDVERLKVIGHNVANLGTTGYKRQQPVQAAVFMDALDAARQSQPLLAGLEVHTDLRPGKLQATRRPLDLALGQGEYLLVQTATRSLALTRDASLVVDATGRLTTPAGLAVQGQGGDIVLPRSAREVRVDAGGQVLADDEVVGTLDVVRVPPGRRLLALGGGLLALADGGTAERAVPTGLRSGYLEASNVVASQEMVGLMTTVRHAESMARLVQGADELLEKAIRKLGEVG